MTVAIPLSAQVIEAELHARGLAHQAEQMAGNKKFSSDVVARVRERIPVAEAVAATLRRVAAQEGRVGA